MTIEYMGKYYIPKKLSRSLCITENIGCFSKFNSLECFPWKLLSYCTGPMNVLSYCTGLRKHVPGGTTFASWLQLKKISGSHFAFPFQLNKRRNLKTYRMRRKLHPKTNIPVILSKKYSFGTPIF